VLFLFIARNNYIKPLYDILYVGWIVGGQLFRELNFYQFVCFIIFPLSGIIYDEKVFIFFRKKRECTN
jgi:hypothetical protein